MNAVTKPAFADKIPDKQETAMLTETERCTLNEAMAIILAHTNEGASWLIDPRWTKGCNDKGADVTFFTSLTHKQVNWIPGETFADKIEYALSVEAEELANPGAATSEQIAYLRGRLAELTGEAA